MDRPVHWPVTVSRLQDEADTKGLITWDVNVDSTVCRAHRPAAGTPEREGPRKEPPGGSSPRRPTTHADDPAAD
ncbi:hypothetical protein [Streptomyces sp. CA-251251]|uniref:hypothetical protein n=1 Tax=Streptomyces sp. CA-251251 TaxID=3240063 RepID=UPI003D8AC54B